jgi:hypothetical protein
MIATLALALTLQAPTNVPGDAEVIYALMPEVNGGGGARLEQTIHSVTTTLSKNAAAYETLSVYKNTAGASGTASIVVPFESWRYGFGDAIDVQAYWDDRRIQPVGNPSIVAPNPDGGPVGRYSWTFNVPVKARGTHSLRLKYKLPIGVSGIDREERLVAYRVADLDQSSALEQFRMAVKFNDKTVFAPIESKPDWGWQVGKDGAYLKLDGKPSDRSAVLTYRYYPAGFADIGWKDDGGGR